MKRRGMKIGLLFLFAVYGSFLSGVAMAQHGHGHGQSGPAMQGSQSGHSMPMMNRPVQEANVEGMKMTLDVMDMSMHVGMQNMKKNPLPGSYDHAKSHAIMLTVQDSASKEILSDAKVRYTLVTPSGEKESGTLMWSGDHFGGSFSPKEKGAYQIQFRVESGGVEREAKFTYEQKT